MDFEIETGFIGESHDFLEDEPDSFDKKRVNKRVNNFPVFVSGMLLQYDLVLNKEMRNVVIQVDIFRNCIQTDEFTETIH